MSYSRREITFSGALAAAALAGGGADAAPMGGAPLYGLISQIIAAPGKRDQLVGVLMEATKDMPGCLSFVIAADAVRGDAIWITEIWTSKESHNAAFNLPKVAIAVARSGPLMASLGARAETTPIGGLGLTRS
jgi:quinol monooxygenase YgiN